MSETPEANNSAAGEALGLGARLRAAREETGLSPAQVAERLHCDPTVVVALENEEFAALGASVYARGHLRRYTEFLRLPVDELQALYERQQAAFGNSPDLTKIARVERPRDANKALRWVYLLAAVLVGLFVVWWVLQSPRAASELPAAPAAVGPPSTAVIESPAAPPVAAATAPADAPPTTTVAGATAVPSTAQTTSSGTAPSPAPTVAPSATPPNNVVKLNLISNADCWTEVYDFEGRQLFFNLVKRGSPQQVSGTGPLRIVIGNAVAMRFGVGGRELTIPSNLQRKGAAFLTLAADGRMEHAQ